MKKKLLYLSLIPIAVLIAAYILNRQFNDTALTVTEKCPDDYADTDAGSVEYVAATNKWTNDFYDSHPGATLSDWAEARHQFWIDNNCTATLQRYSEYKEGKTDPAKVEWIEKMMRETIDQANAQRAASLGDRLYAMTPEERNYFFFMANDEEEYQVVVNATDDGINNHRELVWDDLDFWNHRGVALFQLGRCADAGAAFYHVLLRSPDDEIASSAIDSILNNHCGSTSSTEVTGARD